MGKFIAAISLALSMFALGIDGAQTFTSTLAKHQEAVNHATE